MTRSSSPRRDREHERRALDEVVARRREQPPLRHGAAPVAGAADALHGHRNRSRRSNLTDEIDRADVDAELERRRRDDHAQLAGSSDAVRRRGAILRDRLP